MNLIMEARLPAVGASIVARTRTTLTGGDSDLLKNRAYETLHSVSGSRRRSPFVTASALAVEKG